jgi:hypothetical protein
MGDRAEGEEKEKKNGLSPHPEQIWIGFGLLVQFVNIKKHSLIITQNLSSLDSE